MKCRESNKGESHFANSSLEMVDICKIFYEFAISNVPLYFLKIMFLNLAIFN